MRAHYAHSAEHERRTSPRVAQDVVGFHQESTLFLAERILGKAEVDSSILSGGTIPAPCSVTNTRNEGLGPSLSGGAHNAHFPLGSAGQHAPPDGRFCQKPADERSEEHSPPPPGER
jgi:hypothetical protein